MPQALVTQLSFAREEFQRVMDGVSPAEGERVLAPFNSLSFLVAHMAAHEHSLWVQMAQQRNLYPDIRRKFGAGAEQDVPDWNTAWILWRTVTTEADIYLDTLTDASLDSRLLHKERPARETIGHMMLRLNCHYWFHLGEAHGIRQAMGHTNLPEFVGPVTKTAYL